MNYKKLDELDEIRANFSGCVNLLGALHVCMSEGPDCADEYMDGFYFVYSQLADLAEKMRKALDDLSDESAENTSI